MGFIAKTIRYLMGELEEGMRPFNEKMEEEHRRKTAEMEAWLEERKKRSDEEFEKRVAESRARFEERKKRMGGRW